MIAAALSVRCADAKKGGHRNCGVRLVVRGLWHYLFYHNLLSVDDVDARTEV